MNYNYITSLNTNIKLISVGMIIFNIIILYYLIFKTNSEFIIIITYCITFGSAIIIFISFLLNTHPLLLNNNGIIISLCSSLNIFTSLYKWENIHGVMKDKSGDLCFIYLDTNKNRTHEHIKIPFLFIKEPKEEVLANIKNELRKRNRLLTDET